MTTTILDPDPEIKENSDFEKILLDFDVVEPSKFGSHLAIARSSGRITLNEQLQLIKRYQYHIADKKTPKNFRKTVEISDSTTTTRQERTIAQGVFNLSVKKSDMQIVEKQSLIREAINFISRRGLDAQDIIGVVSKQFSTTHIPYAITGLTTRYLLTGISDSTVRMRPDGATLLKQMATGKDVIIDDKFNQKVTIKPFESVLSTLSYVEKEITSNVGNGFSVSALSSRIEDSGDSFFMQLPRNVLRIENTTEQTLSYEQADRLARNIAVKINHNFDDMVHLKRKMTMNYHNVKSLFLPNDVLTHKSYEKEEQLVSNSFALFNGMYSDVMAELIFDEISSIRDFLMETKSITLPDYNASLRQKFSLIQKPTCDCPKKNALVYGSGAIVSSLVNQILSFNELSSIEFVDPIIDTNITLNQNGRFINFENALYETYKPKHIHYCLVVADIGTYESTRVHFTNDYRYTNYYSGKIYEKFVNSACFITLKSGFAHGMLDINVDSVWHFKPHNPEFWLNISQTSKIPATSFYRPLLLEKLTFNAARIKLWKKDKMLIAISPQYPLFDPMNFLTTKLPFQLTLAKHVPYSNSIHKKRLIPYSRPNLGFLTPEFLSEDRELINNVISSNDVEEAIRKIKSSDITENRKLSIVAYLIGKRMNVIGSKLKQSLGQVHGVIQENKIDATTTENMNYLYSNIGEAGKKITISVLTPKMSDVCVDYQKIERLFLKRHKYVESPLVLFT